MRTGPFIAVVVGVSLLGAVVMVGAVAVLSRDTEPVAVEAAAAAAPAEPEAEPEPEPEPADTAADDESGSAIYGKAEVGEIHIPDDIGPDEAEPEPAPEPEPEPEPEPAAQKGTREAPYAVGETATMGDYEVTVTSFLPDATAAVMAENMFNEEPVNGVYALTGLTVRYIGADEGTPGWNLELVLSGSDAVQYSDVDCGAVEPDSMMDAPTLEHGGSHAGNFCLDVPPEAIDGGVLFVQEASWFDDSRTFFAIP